MTLPALQNFERTIERQIRLLEAKKYLIERKIGRHFRLFEEKRNGIGKKIESKIRQFERKNGIRFDDEVRFIRSWLERPLSTGAVTPSGKVLARAMASYIDPASDGPVVELGPGTGPVTEALVEAGVAPSRLVLVEFNPAFCRILRARYPDATLVQGDAYSLRRLLETLLLEPAAAVVSGLPLVTKPIDSACDSFAMRSILWCPARRSFSSPIRWRRHCPNGSAGSRWKLPNASG